MITHFSPKLNELKESFALGFYVAISCKRTLGIKSFAVSASTIGDAMRDGKPVIRTG